MNKDYQEPDWDDSEMQELAHRFERYLNGGESQSGYFDLDEIEDLIDYYLDNLQDDMAAAVLEHGMQLHPNSPSLLLRQGSMQIGEGNYSEALKRLESASITGESADRYECDLMRTECLANLNRTEEARGLAMDLLNRTDYSIDATALDLVDIFLVSDHPDLALQVALIGHEAAPTTIDMWLSLALCYERNGMSEEAINTYKAIIDHDPYTSEAWFNLGQLKLDVGHYDEAVEAYDYCTSIDPSDIGAWFQKSYSLFQAGKFDKAAEGYETCLKMSSCPLPPAPVSDLPEQDEFSHIGQLYCLAGEAYERQMKFDRAMEYYEMALAIQPGYYEASTGLAGCMLEQERYEDVLKLMKQTIGKNPDDNDYFEAYNLMGDAYAGMQQLEKSYEMYRTSLRLEPEQEAVRLLAGNVLFDLRRYEEAMKLYEDQEKKYPQNKTVHVFKAAAAFQLGNHKQMLDELDAAHKSMPNCYELFFDICPEAKNLNYDELKDL